MGSTADVARDLWQVIDLLEHKAADRAVTEPEREALRAKANELRTRVGAPPRPPTPPRRIVTGSPDPWWNANFTTSTVTSSGSSSYVFVRFG